jgi:hypothetical protein
MTVSRELLTYKLDFVGCRSDGRAVAPNLLENTNFLRKGE